MPSAQLIAMIGRNQMLVGLRRRSAQAVGAWVFALSLLAIPLVMPSFACAEGNTEPPDEAPAPAAPSGASPQTQSAIKTSGLPVPRFVSIRSNAVNAHSGPSTKYPIEWVFSRRGMPVEVVAEFDTWRRIRDPEGTEGWVLQGMLSAKRSIIITGAVRPLRRDPSLTSRPVANAEPGVIGQLLHCHDNWCEVDAGGYRGWLQQSEMWGVYPNERLE
jgi:SH3-like domain-containing protein